MIDRTPKGAAIVVMAKAPRSGEVKTRLSPPLSPGECAALAACFFADVTMAAAALVPTLFVAYSPAGGRDVLASLLPSRVAARWLEQRGADLGERLAAATGEVFARGFGPIVVVGTDSPTLPPEHVAAAIRALEAGEADVTLGPADDGGYYLVGLRRTAPRLFERVEWGTPRVYEQTARNARALSLRLAELPRWYDVDTPADLERLGRELATDEDARRRAPLTTRRLLGVEAIPSRV
jgi:hypothetical protein